MLVIHASRGGVRPGGLWPQYLHQSRVSIQDASWEGEDKDGAGVRTALPPHLPGEWHSAAGLPLVCTAVDFENH